MVKREDTYEMALARKKAVREQKQREYEMLRSAAYQAVPRLGEIDRYLSASGAKIALTALSGDQNALSALKAELEKLSDEKEKLLKAAQVKKIVYDCPACQDTGYRNGKICDCVKTLAKEITVERLSREMPLNNCRFDNFDLKYYPNTELENGVNPRKKMTQIFKLCREYALNFNPLTAKNLLFMGDAGLGKTHLTLAIVSAVIERGFDVIYGSAFNLISTVEKEHFSSEKGDSYQAMLDCELLVIDDLGTEFTSPYALTVLYGLINTRLLAGKPTIINTNLPMSEIERRYTPRVSSRLIGNYTAKKFFGKDIRQLKAMEQN